MSVFLFLSLDFVLLSFAKVVNFFAHLLSFFLLGCPFNMQLLIVMLVCPLSFIPVVFLSFTFSLIN